MKKFIFIICVFLSYMITNKINAIGEKEINIESVIVVEKTPKPVKLIQSYYRIPIDENMQDDIMNVANKNELSQLLVLALINTESGFDANSVSITNDYGLMQINECNIEHMLAELKLTNIMDPLQNVEVGCYMLGSLKAKYNDEHMALMAYNMGEANAQILWDAGIYETDYTRKVDKAKQELEVLKYDHVTILEN